MTDLEDPIGASNKFGRQTDGRRGVIVCLVCLEDKKKDEIEVVKDSRARKYICKGCDEK